MPLQLPRLTAVLLAAAVLGGCTTKGLPACDEDEALRVVYRSYPDGHPDVTRSGLPAFAGQAMIVDSCSNGRCHTPEASGSNRLGTPAGLDFDVRLMEPGEGELRLRRNQNRVADHRHAIAFQVARGYMPPGAAGRRVVDTPPSYELPDVKSKEGRQILENWLACGSPVVAVTQEPSGGDEPGDVCPSPPPPDGYRRSVGFCRVRQPGKAFEVDPTWSSIYENVIHPSCGMDCHVPGDPQLDESGLDLSEQDLAYDELVDVTAEGDACGETEQLLVAPNDADGSLLIDKLTLSREEVCGDRMPVGSRLDDAVVDVIREWIDAGAMND